jgi:hypothetical protein
MRRLDFASCFMVFPLPSRWISGSCVLFSVGVPAFDLTGSLPRALSSVLILVLDPGQCCLSSFSASGFVCLRPCLVFRFGCRLLVQFLFCSAHSSFGSSVRQASLGRLQCQQASPLSSRSEPLNFLLSAQES